MANCKSIYGISTTCGDLLYPGGADKDFWVGYTSELSSRFSLSQSADISSIGFTAYNGLRKFEGQKFAHAFTSEISVGAGGNISFIHRAAIKLITQSTQDDVEIQRLAQSVDAFIIYQNNNEQFFIIGASKGLKVVAGALQSTGTSTGDDIADMLTLEGAEKTKPLRFSSSSYTATLALLNSYVV